MNYPKIASASTSSQSNPTPSTSQHNNPPLSSNQLYNAHPRSMPRQAQQAPMAYQTKLPPFRSLDFPLMGAPQETVVPQSGYTASDMSPPMRTYENSGYNSNHGWSRSAGPASISPTASASTSTTPDPRPSSKSGPTQFRPSPQTPSITIPFVNQVSPPSFMSEINRGMDPRSIAGQKRPRADSSVYPSMPPPALRTSNSQSSNNAQPQPPQSPLQYLSAPLYAFVQDMHNPYVRPPQQPMSQNQALGSSHPQPRQRQQQPQQQQQPSNQYEGNERPYNTPHPQPALYATHSYTGSTSYAQDDWRAPVQQSPTIASVHSSQADSRPVSTHASSVQSTSTAPAPVPIIPTGSGITKDNPFWIAAEQAAAAGKPVPQILEHCQALFDFSARYAQAQAQATAERGTSTRVQPPPHQLQEMTQRATLVVHLIDQYSRLRAQPQAPVAERKPSSERSVTSEAPRPSSSGSSTPDTAGPSSHKDAQAKAEKDMDTIKTKRHAIGNNVSPASRSKYKKRSRANPPGRCHSCNIRETPEWRRGPDGARTLCNACGLHYAKLIRKRDRSLNGSPDGSLPPIDMEMLRASSRIAAGLDVTEDSTSPVMPTGSAIPGQFSQTTSPHPNYPMPQFPEITWSVPQAMHSRTPPQWSSSRNDFAQDQFPSSSIRTSHPASSPRSLVRSFAQ